MDVDGIYKGKKILTEAVADIHADGGDRFLSVSGRVGDLYTHEDSVAGAEGWKDVDGE